MRTAALVKPRLAHPYKVVLTAFIRDGIKCANQGIPAYGCLNWRIQIKEEEISVDIDSVPEYWAGMLAR